MKNRCDGCGAKIQSVDPSQKGYIKSEVYLKNPENFLCERCYNLVHYNKKLDVKIEESDFYHNIDKIAKSGGLIVNIVDIFDLEGTTIKELNEYFPNNKILIVGNKFDLFLNSVKVMRVKNYMMEFLKEKNIMFHQSLLISSFNNEDIHLLLQKIDEMQDGNDVYLFGMTNVGKSTIINKICNYLNIPSTITVSNMVGTTLDFIKITLPNKTFLIDTPGILNKGQVTYYLDKENLNLLSPKKYIKPLVYQLNSDQALIIGGFGLIKFLEGTRSSFVAYLPPTLVCHRTKSENADQFLMEHVDDILKIPNQNERARMGSFKTYHFSFDETNKIDITISGLGFVTLVGKGTVEAKFYEVIKVGTREAII